MGKIFVYRWTERFQDAVGVAYAEDGEQLAFHVSSSLDWFRHDMGLKDEARGEWHWKRDAYREKYPDGYEVVEVLGPEKLQEYIDSGALKGVTLTGAKPDGSPSRYDIEDADPNFHAADNVTD